jgi:hypothetical protein
MPLLLTPTRSTPDLRGRLADLRRGWRRLLVVRGKGTVVFAVIAAAAVVGGLDAVIIVPALVRASALVALLAVIGLLVLRVAGQFRALGDDLALALRVEEHFPSLGDALASSIQFERQEIGSPDLRRETRRRAVRLAEHCGFRELLDRWPARRALAAVAIAAAIVAPLVLKYPATSRTAVIRLLDPFGDHPWPAKTLLSIDAPDWLARGEPFVLRGRLGGVIPERVRFGFAFDGTPPAEQSVPVVGGEEDGSFALRLEPNRVPRDFRYRVVGNDADTLWRSVRVVTPPQLAPLDGRASPLIHLEFPKYTELPPADLPDGATAIDCVPGTVVRIRAATDRPVDRAWVELAGDPPDTTIAAVLLPLTAGHPTAAIAATAAGRSASAPIRATIAEGGRRFELLFRPYVGGTYLLRLADESGLDGRRTLDLRLTLDPSPVVTLERPAAGQDSLNVLAGATVPLLARADDSTFAVRRAWLEYRCGADEPIQKLPLYGTAAPGEEAPLRPRLQSVRIEQRLELTRLRHANGRLLGDGDAVTIQVAADDFDDVTVPKPPGRSHEVELRVVSPEVLSAAVQKAEVELQRELQELLRLQRDALERTTPAEAERQRTGSLRPEDVEGMLRAEQLQQQLRSRMGRERDGVRAAVDRLRGTMRDNSLPTSPQRDRLDALAAELDRLAREELEPIEPLLAEARSERGPVAPETRKGGPLPRALQHQRESERTFEDLLDLMRPWGDAREARAEAGALSRDQQKLGGERATLEAQGLMGKPPDQLSGEQRRQLERLAEHQTELAERAAELLGKLDRKIGEKQSAAAGKDAEAAVFEERAAGIDRKSAANSGGDTADDARRQAAEFRKQAEAERAAATADRREADALTAARDAAQKDPAMRTEAASAADPSLAGRQREAADKLARNELGQAAQAQDAADRMLKAMQEALHDSGETDADRLAKKQRLDAAEQELDQIIRAQEQLQQRADEAGRIADAGQRKQELERLAREQDQLRERAGELARRLTRLRGESAADELRRAARAMDRARDAMDEAESSTEKLDNVLDRLDDAQDQLRQTRKDAEGELQRERRAKLTEALKGLKNRQESQVAESERLFQAARQAGGWSRPLQKSLADLGDAEAALGREIGPLGERHVHDAKVAAHFLGEAAEALAEVGPAVERMRDGPMDLDAWEADRGTIQAPQRLALKRLTQLLDGLKNDPRDRAAGVGDKSQSGDAGRDATADEIPALTQLKLLRALQAEINEWTDAFAKAHPDLSKLTARQQAELDAIRKAQANVATLLDDAAPNDGGDGSGGKDPPSADGSLNRARFALSSSPPDRLEKRSPPAGDDGEHGSRPTKSDVQPPAGDRSENADAATDEAAKLREKTLREMQAAEAKLRERDPGQATRKLQDEALRNIDKLIDLARNPPPQPQQQQPMGGPSRPQAGGQSQPQSGQARRDRREQRRRQMEQQAQRAPEPRSQPRQGTEASVQPSAGNAGRPGMAGGSSRREPDRLADVVKDIWGHLPETMRQEVDHYYRDRFMPRYRDLVQEYYMRLAERDRTRREGR